LIGPDTVNTIPDQTLAAARDHGTPARTIDRDLERAHETMRLVREAGVDVDQIVLGQLVDEGVTAFGDSYDALLETLELKARELTPV
jgi:transaldolase